MISARATFWLRALALPKRPAEMITFSAAATRRRPVTANSRAMITIATHAATAPVSTSDTSTAEISSLSARGSRKAPATVTMPRERASQPSSESVAHASTNTASAHHCPPGMLSTSSSTIRGGISRIRTEVSQSGAFIGPDRTRPAYPPVAPRLPSARVRA